MAGFLGTAVVAEVPVYIYPPIAQLHSSTAPQLPGIAGREAALHWIHHNQPAPLVDTATQSKGEGLRSAALAFYSQIQHERHVTGRSTRMPNPQPEYLVEPEHAHLLAPFASPNPL